MIGRLLFIRDSRLSRTTKLVLAALTIALLIALFPLRLALGALADDSDVFSARAVEGIVWDGRAGDVVLAGLPLGTLDVALRPQSLLSGGNFSVSREVVSGEPGFEAIIGGGQGRLTIRDANGEVDLAGTLAPLPVRAASFAEFTLEMQGGRCIEAGGRLGLVIPALGQLIASETTLSGEAHCEEGALVVPMVGPTGMERLLFRLEPDGRWNADLQLSDLPVEMSEPLLDMGFTGRPNGIGFAASGSL